MARRARGIVAAVPNEGVDRNCDIPVSRFEEVEFDDIDEYLADEINYRIYAWLRQHFDSINPVAFFKRYYSTLTFVKANLDRPIAVEKKIKEEWDFQSVYFLLKGLALYSEYLFDRFNDPRMFQSAALKHIRQLSREVDEDIEAEVILYQQALFAKDAGNTKKFDWYLATTHDKNAKREFLTRIKSDLAFRVRISEGAAKVTYKERLEWINCKLEELEELTKLETGSKKNAILTPATHANKTKNDKDETSINASPRVTTNVSESECPTCGKCEKHKDRNLERAVLILSVIFEELGIKAHTLQQIDAIRVITGYSGQTIKELMYKNGTNVKKATDLPTAYKKDFEFVCELFRKLERADLAKKTKAKE